MWSRIADGCVLRRVLVGRYHGIPVVGRRTSNAGCRPRVSTVRLNCSRINTIPTERVDSRDVPRVLTPISRTHEPTQRRIQWLAGDSPHKSADNEFLVVHLSTGFGALENPDSGIQEDLSAGRPVGRTDELTDRRTDTRIELSLDVFFDVGGGRSSRNERRPSSCPVIQSTVCVVIWDSTAAGTHRGPNRRHVAERSTDAGRSAEVAAAGPRRVLSISLTPSCSMQCTRSVSMFVVVDNYRQTQTDPPLGPLNWPAVTQYDAWSDAGLYSTPTDV